MSRLSWTVCPHGAGHAVRSLRVLGALLEDAPEELQVTVALHPATVATLSGPLRTVLDDPHVIVVDDVLEPAAADRADVGWLTAWLPRWAADERLSDADVVVSDNLTAMLVVRPDAVLLGSFLWSDVLGHLGGDAAAFAEAEDRLLAAHRPTMLTTADVAHPGTARTQAVGLPWFADRPGTRTTVGPEPVRAPAERSGRVAVAGGATGRADALLGRAAEFLAARGVAVGEDATDCDVVVCRPGLGSVTDAVVRATPMVLLREPGEPELAHTARTLAAAGLAVDAGDDPAGAGAAAERLLGGAERDAMVAALVARPTGGHRRAARLIAERLG